MKDTPIFINTKDRVTYTRQLVDRLRSQGYVNLHLLDTGSTWPPMLEFLAGCGLTVWKLTPKGPPKLALWEGSVLTRSKNHNRYYVYTDCDVLPDCPADWIDVLRRALDEHPRFLKAGLGLRIDDLPDCYDRKQAVIDWESQFSKKTVSPGLFDAPVDTTFALYRPKTGFNMRAVRTGAPYQARHLPWYEDSDHPTPEFLHYQAHLHPRAMAYWTRGTHPLTLPKSPKRSDAAG